EAPAQRGRAGGARSVGAGRGEEVPLRPRPGEGRSLHPVGGFRLLRDAGEAGDGAEVAGGGWPELQRAGRRPRRARWGGGGDRGVQRRHDVGDGAHVSSAGWQDRTVPVLTKLTV